MTIRWGKENTRLYDMKASNLQHTPDRSFAGELWNSRHRLRGVMHPHNMKTMDVSEEYVILFIYNPSCNEMQGVKVLASRVNAVFCVD